MNIRAPEMTPSRRILLVANETAHSDVVQRAIAMRATTGPVEVFVVAPALNSRLRHWTSDEDGACRAAEERLVCCLAQLRHEGIQARGRVGDADPMRAIADALRLFAADELIIATHAERRSNWLARDIVGRTRASLELPVRHVVVDPELGEEYVADDPGARVDHPAGRNGRMPERSMSSLAAVL
jgi:hypothetical protein